jgi:hypothetical protein
LKRLWLREDLGDRHRRDEGIEGIARRISQRLVAKGWGS